MGAHDTRAVKRGAVLSYTSLTELGRAAGAPSQGQLKFIQHARETRKFDVLAAEPRGHAEIRQLGRGRGKFAGGKRSGELQRRLARRFAATGAFQLPQHALIEKRGGLSGRTLWPQADFGRAYFPRPYLPGEEQALAQPA